MGQDTLDTRHIFRVSKAGLEKFKATAQNVYGKDHNDLLRELMDAANDGRVKITPTEEQRKTLQSSGDLYDVN